MSISMQRLDASQADFEQQLSRLLAWERVSDEKINAIVDEVIARVRREGDAALVEYSNRFDRTRASSMRELELGQARLQQALANLPAEQRAALETAAERVRGYHERQKGESWQYTEADGTLLGQQITPLDRVGIYVPGGKAAYPSSVLMNALPAHVAGVGEIIMVVPTPDGVLNELVLAAAALAGVDRVFTLGGGAGGGGTGLRHRNGAAGGQDRRAGQHLCGHGQACRFRHRRHRYDRGPLGNSGGV